MQSASIRRRIGSQVLAAALWAACAALYAGEESAWEKVPAQDLPLPRIDQILSPGLFDGELRRTVLCPPDGKPVDFGLPHDGTGADKRPYPALMGAYKRAGAQGFLWLDLNADGKQDPAEALPVKDGQELGPFRWEAHYDDGTSGPYLFKLKHSGEAGHFTVLRAQGKQARFKQHAVVLLDENGNGRYDDLGQDAVLVQGQPITFLSRQLYLGDDLFELLVHPAGQTLELRPLPKTEMGEVNLFHMYRPAQKSEALRFHTLIVQGRDGAFSFDDQIKSRMLPAGAYDLVFGLLERGTERVILKRGERTSFTVEPGKIATPAWGGPVAGKLNLESDGKVVKVHKPLFMGQGSEIYLPTDWEKIPLRAALYYIWYDQVYRAERSDVSGNKPYELKPNGDLAPVEFAIVSSNEYKVVVEYKSGILGTVKAEERVNLVAKR